MYIKQTINSRASPPPFSVVSACCAGILIGSEYNVYCSRMHVFHLFDTIPNAPSQIHHSPALLPPFCAGLAGRAGNQSVNVSVVDVYVLMLHNLPSFAG